MDMIRQAQHRIDQREQERRFKERRAAEYRDALEELDRREYQAQFLDNAAQLREVNKVRALRKEIGAMQDEDFGLSEQLQQLGD